jgi:hypothetical protein
MAMDVPVSMMNTSGMAGTAEVGGAAVPAHYAARKWIGWPAILAGVAAALSVQLILSLLGIALGMSMVAPSRVEPTIDGLGMGVLVWACLSGLIAFGVGGFVAGNATNSAFVCNAALHGMLVWATAGVLGVTLVALSGSMMAGGAGAGLGGAASGLSGMAVQSSGAWGGSGRSLDDTARTRETSSRTGERLENASSTSDVQSMPRTTAEAREMAEKAARYTARASLFAAIALCMGAVGGTLGSTMGRKAREKVDEQPVRTDR